MTVWNDSETPEKLDVELDKSNMGFTPPRCRYESGVRYKNTLGQEFAIRVSGLDSDAVERYVKELQEQGVLLEVVPYSPDEFEDTRIKDETTIEETLQDLEISIIVLHAGDVKPPYILRFVFGEAITLSSSHVYDFYNFTDSGQAKVWLYAKSTGPVRGRLRQDGNPIDSARVDLIAGNGISSSDLLSSALLNGQTSSFNVAVWGNAGEKYQLSGDVPTGTVTLS